VVSGTETIRPRLPTRVRTISVATTWVVSTSEAPRPEEMNSSSSGSDAPA
jgi:hypothetical protein